MRDVPQGLLASIASGAATLCHAWIVDTTSGDRLGFTDHDQALTVDGVTCSAQSGWTAGAADTALGFSPGDASAVGVLDDAALDADALESGALDGATVALWRVDWSNPGQRVRLWCGVISKLQRQGDQFTADIDGPLAALSVVVGRTFGRTCDANLGDARCGVDPAAFPGRTCDKRWATCTGVFDNGVNFQGFPDIPGDDYLAVYPREGDRHDGGSRR